MDKGIHRDIINTYSVDKVEYWSLSIKIFTMMAYINISDPLFQQPDIFVDSPDFSDLDAITPQIEKGTLKFIQDIENLLSKIVSGE